MVITASNIQVTGARLKSRIASSYQANACCQGTMRG
jgi:hypothetical protein